MNIKIETERCFKIMWKSRGYAQGIGCHNLALLIVYLELFLAGV